MRDLVGPRVELPITQFISLKDQGHGIGGPLRLQLDKLVDQTVAGVIHGRIVPLGQQPRSCCSPSKGS